MAKKNPSAKGPRKKGDRYSRLVLWGIAISAIAIVLLLWSPWQKNKTAGRKPAPAKVAEHEQKIPERLAVVAIVIDDLGQDLKTAQEVLELPGKVTLSVLPRLPQSKRVAEIAKQSGREVLLHIPMEPKDRNIRQSPGTLRSDMTPMEFIETVNGNLDAVPGAAGVNNHEGSALTENREAMNFLMSELKARGLFYLDSMTSPKSIAFPAAGEFGIKRAKRDVFLDNGSASAAAVGKQLKELSRIAKKQGSAIAIGHPRPGTLKELKDWLAKAPEEGIEVVPVSYLVK